jgi:SAM-dependent methyltransferase
MRDGDFKIEAPHSPYQEISLCPACDCSHLDLIYDFGDVPLAGYFPLPGKSDDRFLVPMQLRSCRECQLVQVNPDVSDELLFADYRYVSSVGMQPHFDSFAAWFDGSNLANRNSKILEIGCNDGPLLDSLTKLGFRPIGIDPASNIVQQAKDKGLEVICDFFNLRGVTKHNLENTFDVIISCNSFAHISDINQIAAGVAKALNEDGVFIVEVQSLQDMVESKAYDFVYHEHKYYYSISSISNLLNRHGMYLIDGMHIVTHGGSLRLVFSKNQKIKSRILNELIEREQSADLTVGAIAASVGAFMTELNKLRDFLRIAEKGDQLCVGVGASGRANMLLNYLQPEAKAIMAVYDQSPERIGREMALSGIPVMPLESSAESSAENVLILAWNFSEVLMKKWPNKQTTFVLPLPKFEILKKSGQ